jgi:DNA-binding Xre family transcriptional regulator
MSRLSKNEYISMDILGRTCEHFNYDIGDIFEYVSEKNEVIK